MKSTLFDEVNRFTPRRKFINLGKDGSGELKDSGIVSPRTKGSADKAVWIIVVFAFLAIISGLVLASRAVGLMILQNQRYLALADQNKTRKSVIMAERGVIYGADDEILVRNKPSFAVELNVTLCGSLCGRILNKVSSIVSVDIPAVTKEIQSGRGALIISQGLSKDQELLVESNLYQLPGVSVVVYPIRDYLYPEVFAHSLGYVGLDDKSLEPNVIGRSGVEKSYDTDISGIPGNTISEVDSTGRNYIVVAQQNSLPGRDVVTYLNRDLSVKAYELIKQVVDKKEATGGVVVATDPSTGGVLILVSYPSFDANKMSEGLSIQDYKTLTENPLHPFFNRAVSGEYAPGSTFKMITASAALSEGVVTQNTTIFDHGFIAVGGSRFNNWKLDGSGEVNMIKAIQVSNDTYFYTVGGGYGGIKGVGIDKLSTWGKRFGIGKPLGLDIAGESSGYMPDGKSRAWYLGDTYITSIGQGDVLTTPLQMNAVTAYFANGGYLMKPRLVKQLVGSEIFKPEIITQGLITKTNYEIIREGLRRAVLPGGTAYPLFDFAQRHPGIELGGKTGTSEYINSDGKPATHAWFTVFGPFNNANIALTVFLEGGGGGSDVAAPIAKELLDLWFASSTNKAK